MSEGEGQPRRTRRLLWVFGAMLVLWCIIAWGVIPALIRGAYAGESFAVLNRLITGQARRSVDGYLALWSRTALQVTAVLVAAATGITLVVTFRRWVAVRFTRLARALPNLSAAQSFVVSLALGVSFGLIEAINALVRHRLQHLPTGDVTGGEVLWMAPLAAASALGIVALLLLIVAFVARPIDPHRILVRLVPTACVVLGVWSLSKALHTGIAGYAGVIAGLGIAVASTRALCRWPRLASRSHLALGVAAIAFTAWGLAVPLARRVMAGGSAPDRPTPPAEAPNVLVVIWDTVRALSMSTYGYERPTTPELDRLVAKSGGVVFERAFATAPWSLPSHASMFTGRYPNALSTGYSLPLDESVPTIAEEMAKRGWATGGFTGNLFYGSPSYGIARGFDWYDARPPVTLSVVSHTWWLSRRALQIVKRRYLQNYQHLMRRSADHVNDAFLAWQENQGERPFFAVLNYFDAHEPYLAPEPFNLAFSKTQPRYWHPASHQKHPRNILEQYRTAYETCVLYLDHELGRVLSALEQRGVLRNTLVIVTSDHGEAFGEHSPALIEHSRSLYTPLLHVPMVVLFPSRIREEIRRSEVVSIRDIPATVMDAVGASDGRAFPGVSLLSYANRDSATADQRAPRLSIAEHFSWSGTWDDWPASNGNMFSVAVGDRHYIVDPDGKERLFDIAKDPWEMRDIASAPEERSTLERMRAVLDSLAPKQQNVRPARVER
jgi:arylsulfatase A-like enzyme